MGAVAAVFVLATGVAQAQTISIGISPVGSSNYALGKVLEQLGLKDRVVPFGCGQQIPSLINSKQQRWCRMRCVLALLGVAKLSELGARFLAPAEPLARNWLESAFPLVREDYGARRPRSGSCRSSCRNESIIREID